MESGVRRIMGDEHGFTLLEVLAAVTIMALITVTVIGHFIAAQDRSKEEGRRIIAAHLARSKTAEIRNAGKESDLDPDRTNYQLLRAEITGYQALYTAASPMLAAFDSGGKYSDLLKDTAVNGTVYRYEVTVVRDGGNGSRTASLTGQMSGGRLSEEYLMRILMRVTWDDSGGGTAAKTTTLDAYIVDRR